MLTLGGATFSLANFTHFTPQEVAWPGWLENKISQYMIYVMVLDIALPKTKRAWYCPAKSISP